MPASPAPSAERAPAGEGVLPSQDLARLLGRVILAEGGFADGQVQPASVDLRLGARIWRIRASFLPGPDATVAARVAELGMHEIALAPEGTVLEKGCVYLVELRERLALPPGLDGVANAKSSTGRLDLLTRVVCERGTEFDRIPAGYRGPLYAEICPRSFSVLVRPGQRLTQLRLRRGNAVLDDAALRALHAATPLVDREPVISAGLGFSVDLRPEGGARAGWRARPHAGLIDLDRIGAYAARDFWEPVAAEGGRIILDPGAFYILMSREAVTIPPGHAAEMAPYLAMAGEFRVHYAGFFDPGFGWAEAGGAGSRGVLEVRCHEAPFVLEHGQTVGRLVYERMAAPPAALYGRDLRSSYQGQRLRLAKQFRDDG